MGAGVLEAALEHKVLKGIFVVLLTGFVEVVHVELSGGSGTCRTKEV